MTADQKSFAAALLDPAHPVPDTLRDGQTRPAGRRFNVYRNNVAASLTEAMHVAFPVITKLLGPRNMDGLAGIYLRAHPPASPLMMFYGDAFPAFLEGMEQLRHLGYLPDMARLELALRHAYHAGDASPIAPEALGAMPPETLAETRLGLAPAVSLLRSDWPIFDIWRFNTVDGAPKPRHMAQDVLITRPEFDPVPQLLPPGGAAWVTALLQGRTLGAAQEAAQAAGPDFDLGAALTLLLQGNAITSVTPKGPAHDPADLAP